MNRARALEDLVEPMVDVCTSVDPGSKPEGLFSRVALQVTECGIFLLYHVFNTGAPPNLVKTRSMFDFYHLRSTDAASSLGHTEHSIEPRENPETAQGGGWARICTTNFVRVGPNKLECKITYENISLPVAYTTPDS